jgi:hypothetical protein
MYLGTNSRIGFTICIAAGEWIPRSVAHELLSLHGSQENIRCVMGYIVNLTVILDYIFRTSGGNVTGNAAREVMGTHVRSGRRDSIHQDIRSFVKEMFLIMPTFSEKDLVVERIVQLIEKYRAPPNS